MESIRERLLVFAQARNASLAQDAGIQGGLALVFGVLTFGGFWWIAWLMFGSFRAGALSPIPLALTAVYAGAATWSAWRGVDPLGGLSPLTQGEASRRDLEAAVSELVGGSGLETIGTREGVAGCADWLVAGPRGVFAAWAKWRRRIVLQGEVLDEAVALLSAARAGGALLAGREGGGVALLALGLARFELDAEGEGRAILSAKGARVAGETD